VTKCTPPLAINVYISLFVDGFQACKTSSIQKRGNIGSEEIEFAHALQLGLWNYRS
jgi:hypothetical protein